MNVDRFRRDREPCWTELDALVVAARRRPERLGAPGVVRLSALYRQAAADLAVARRAFPGETVVDRLETLVGAARSLVYDAETRRRSVREFFGRRYWQLVRSRPRLLLLAAALLFVPAAIAWWWAAVDPGRASGLVPAAFQAVSDPRPADESLGLSSSEAGAFSAQILTNNIRVTFLAFAGGISGGAITAAALIFNGVLFGTIGGLAVAAGTSERFTTLVIAHGVLELSCIVVAGSAGLGLGLALVAPGKRARLPALRDEARHAVELTLGTAPWLVLAGLVEGFVTPAGHGLVVNAIVGVTLGAAFWALVLLRGGRVTSV